MRDYNGFSGRQRQRAQNWLNREWDWGRFARPSKCIACGQTARVIDAHAEDYSDPFRAGVTDGFHLCRICHSMVHLRSTNPKAWRDYRSKVEAGGRAKILKENQRYPGGTSKFTTDDMFDWGSPPQRQALLEIELSQDEAARRFGGRPAGPRARMKHRPSPLGFGLVKNPNDLVLLRLQPSSPR